MVGTSELISCRPPLLLHQVRYVGVSCPILIPFFYLEILTGEFHNYSDLFGMLGPLSVLLEELLHRASTGVAYSWEPVSHLMHEVQLYSKISRGWRKWRNAGLKVHIRQNHCVHTERAQTVPEKRQNKPAQTFTGCTCRQPDSSMSFPNKAQTDHLCNVETGFSAFLENLSLP